MHSPKTIAIYRTVTAFLLVSLITIFTPHAIAARLALVVGNDTYSKIDHLVNARNDARAMSRELKAAGFDVTQLVDANYRDMVGTLGKFVQRVKAGDEVVFFFSGHGVQIKSGSYLLPVDINGDTEALIERTALALDDAMDQIKQAKPRFTLVLVDACRSNPFKTAGRNIGDARGLKPPEPPKGQMVVFSAGRGQGALDRLRKNDTNPNGLFTREFIAQMRSKGVSIEQLVREVQDSVERQAASIGHKQRPALYNESRGNFYFYAPTTINVQPNPAPIPPTPVVHVQSVEEIEQQAWDAAQRVNQLAAFKAYLEEYPTGRFAAAARIRVAGLTPPVPVPVPPKVESVQPQFQIGIKTKVTGYPLNEIAKKYGLIESTFFDRGIGRVDFEMTIGDHNLKGEAIAGNNTSNTWGTIHTQIYGSSYTNQKMNTSTSTRGIAMAYSATGLRLDCEYIINNLEYTGIGVCTTSDGAHYKIMSRPIY